MRVLLAVLCVVLLAAACGADDGTDVVDSVGDAADAIAPAGDTEDDFDDEDFASDADQDDDEDDDEFDDSELDGPEADDTTAVADEAFCTENPNEVACDDFFDNLSDEDYCRILPDDDFCAEIGLGQDAAATDEPELQTVTGPGSIAVAGINPSATRDDGQCLPEEDAESDQSGVEFNLAYQVVNGELGAVCFGSADETVEQAWRVLADLTPPGQLRDLAVFAGFASTEEDNVTLAFVQALNDDATDYLMAVNITETQNDWDEATLTMAHEFSHVFTALPNQLDRTIPAEDCETFDNGEGCYLAESIMNQWFDLFWQSAPGDPTAEADADQRCEIDSGFFGNYAASTPEEDFAESFSAYVLRVEPKTEGQTARLQWIGEQAGLQEFQERAIELNYGPLAHNFDRCG